MRFRVTNQYGRSPENILAEFKNQADAESFIMVKIQPDVLMKINVIYKLYDTLDLIKEFDSAAIQIDEASSSSATGTTGSASGAASGGARFSPTPLNNAPTPPGMPKNWWKDDEEKERK